MDDDVVDRLVEREEEIRRRLESGAIDDDDAAALRDLIGDPGDGPAGGAGERMRISVDQLNRMVDEGIGADKLRALVDLVPAMVIDDAIDLIADYDPEISWLRDVASAGLTDLGSHQLRELLENDLDPRQLARMFDACPDLDLETAINLCVEEVDPDALQRLRDEGIDVDTERLTRPSVTVSLLNLRLGDRHVLVGAGRERIRRSGTVTGFYVGDVTVNPGVSVDFAATLIGTLHIEPGAEAVIRGRVTGSIDNRGVVREPDLASS